jgi:hypothetical protein
MDSIKSPAQSKEAPEKAPSLHDPENGRMSSLQEVIERVRSPSTEKEPAQETDKSVETISPDEIKPNKMTEAQQTTKQPRIIDATSGQENFKILVTTDPLSEFANKDEITFLGNVVETKHEEAVNGHKPNN